ncbi:hypothetical protein HAX54_020684, partial [Datura stramonium]|nr:hypothetical protein [Datura stramonium]
ISVVAALPTLTRTRMGMTRLLSCRSAGVACWAMWQHAFHAHFMKSSSKLIPTFLLAHASSY